MDAVNLFLDKKGEEASRYRLKIKEMMGSGEYSFAEETLLGILDFIDENDSITAKQIEAVNNIEHSV